MKQKVLIVEDDAHMAGLLRDAVEGSLLAADHVDSGAAGLEKALEGGYCLVILDLNLPDLDGFDLCRRVRDQNPETSILIVSSRDAELDKVLGLELGADDYIVKPFGQRELQARMKALLRRSARAAGSDSSLRVGEIHLNAATREVKISGRDVSLTALEFDILWFLASQPGRVFTREELMESVWEYQSSEFGPSITAQMSRLRQKIEADPGNPNFLVTVRGVGYRLNGSR